MRAKLYDTEVVLEENTKESKSIEDRGVENGVGI